MDEVEKLIKEITEDRDFQRTNFKSGFLNNVAEVFERYGFGETKIFLIDKEKRDATRWQAKTLLKVIEKFEEYPRIRQDRSTGRLIIKMLDTLKRR